MSDTVHATRKELSSREILDIVRDGGRVRIETSVLGATTQVVLRQQDGTYYCDTPMKLLTHETPEAFRTCLERFRLAKPSGEDDHDDTIRAAGT